MPVETELKFRIPTRRVAVLTGARLPRFSKGPTEHARLISTYFDTARHKFRRHGLTLRVRTTGAKRIQTVKADTHGQTVRGEWESEIDGLTPDLQRASDSPLRKFGATKLGRKIKPVFKTLVRRTTMPLRSGSANIELAIDRGRIAAGRRGSRIDEVELELKHGAPSELFRLARAIERRTGAELYLASKADRGYELVRGQLHSAHFAAPITLQSDITSIEAFRIIARSTVEQFANNADAVRAQDPEGIHQMRVGLRRTRAAISIFAEMLPRSHTEHIKSELKWLTNELAPARELDVFMRKKVNPARRDSVSKRGARALGGEFAARRRRAFTQARAAVASSRYRQLLIDILEWLETELHSRFQAARRSVAAFAENVLHHRMKKIRKGGKDLDSLTARERHKLRIKIKKIRYALEFFDSLYADKGERRKLELASKRLKALQDALGALNDFTAHRELTADAALHAPRSHRRARALAAGAMLGREQEAIKPLLKTAAKTIKRLGPVPSAQQRI
jgi:inorganic triphosphatase YgiF